MEDDELVDATVMESGEVSNGVLTLESNDGVSMESEPVQTTECSELKAQSPTVRDEISPPSLESNCAPIEAEAQELNLAKSTSDMQDRAFQSAEAVHANAQTNSQLVETSEPMEQSETGDLSGELPEKTNQSVDGPEEDMEDGELSDGDDNDVNEHTPPTSSTEGRSL